MLLVVFAVNESQKKAYTASISQAGSGEAASNFQFRLGAVAPFYTLTDRGRPTKTPSDKQQHGSSSCCAVASQQPLPQQQQRRRRGQGRRWRWQCPRQMSCGTAARLGLARSPRSPHQQNSQFFYIYFWKQMQETPTAAAAQKPPHSSSSSSSRGSSGGGGGLAAWVAVAVEASATALWYTDGV